MKSWFAFIIYLGALPVEVPDLVVLFWSLVQIAADLDERSDNHHPEEELFPSLSEFFSFAFFRPSVFFYSSFLEVF